MADHTVTYRLIVKEIATKYGIYATFMPKPLFGENGSGMHTHQSLFTNGKNAFYDADDEWHLSPTGKHFIAGLLHHAREICAIFAQWVNSYKRLVPGYEAPVYVAWSRRNRSALIRIPLYFPGKEQATRAEIRCPDPACNPYLTFAALLQAGLEGIEKEYELPEPMEENLFELTPGRARGAGHHQPAAEPRRGDRGARALGSLSPNPRAAHLRPIRRAEAEGVGRVPGPGHAVGARALPVDPVGRGPASESERVVGRTRDGSGLYAARSVSRSTLSAMTCSWGRSPRSRRPARSAGGASVKPASDRQPRVAVGRARCSTRPTTRPARVRNEVAGDGSEDVRIARSHRCEPSEATGSPAHRRERERERHPAYHRK